MDGGGGNAWGNRMTEAERWLTIAGKLLEVRDLVGCKRFAERAIDASPLLDGVDRISAAADVLLASQRRINNHLDWYSVLGLDPSLPGGHDDSAVKRAYRRRALLLHPEKHRSSPSAGADQAHNLVSDAWAFLSDPTKKRLYDDEIRIAAAHLGSNGPEKPRPPSPTPPPPPSPPPETFWTMCASCFRAYEYQKEHEGRILYCHLCRKPFEGAKLPTPPPVVPGTDMYYCSWGVFPLGFPGCPLSVPVPPGTPTFPAFPNNVPLQQQQPGDKKTPEKRNAGEFTPTRSSARLAAKTSPPSTAPPIATTNSVSPAKRPKKIKAQRPKKQGTGAQTQQPGMAFQASEGTQGQNAGDCSGGFDMNSFSIDLDSSAEVLRNLDGLSFL